MYRGKVESCSKIKDGNGRLVMGDDEVRRISKDFFEDLYYMDTQEEDLVHICGFDGAQRGNYFLISRNDVDLRVGVVADWI